MPYSAAFKARMVEKMLGANGWSATSLAREMGMAQTTLSRWLRQAGTLEGMSNGSKSSKGKKSTRKWTTEDKFRVVVEARALSEEELGAYLRREGVREGQLRQWEEAIQEALGSTKNKKSKKSKKSAEGKKIKELERELRRKDKALAEAWPLLVLKKKPPQQNRWVNSGSGSLPRA